MEDTVFDRILRGELPAHVVAQDAETFAFLDIHPAAVGHTLVVPRVRSRDLLDTGEAAVVAVARTVRRVAGLLHAVYAPDGITVLHSTGRAAGQDVPYFHVHVIPRWSGDAVEIGHTVVEGSDLADVAHRLRRADAALSPRTQ